MNSASLVVAPGPLPTWVHWASGSGMSQWLSYCRSSAWPLFPQSGFVESGRGPALSNLTPTSLMQWSKIGLHLNSFVGGFLFVCLWKPLQNMCVTESMWFLVETFVIQGIFHSGFPNSTSKNQEFSLSSRYFNVVLKERWGRGRGMSSTLSTYPSPRQLGFANPCQAMSCWGQKLPAYFCWVYERCEHTVFLGSDVECK